MRRRRGCWHGPGSFWTGQKNRWQDIHLYITRGFLHDAQKEYAEGQITLSLASESPLPDPDELRVGYPAYLNGMGEAVGEMRRHILDTLRKGDIDLCERKLEQIDIIYMALTTIDFPDGITSGAPADDGYGKGSGGAYAGRPDGGLSTAPAGTVAAEAGGKAGGYLAVGWGL